MSRPGNGCSGRHSCCFETHWKTAACKGSPPHTASPKPAKACVTAACKGFLLSPKPAKACLTAACKGFLHFHKEAHTLFFSHPSVQHGPSREVVPIGILTTFQNELLQVSHGFHHARVLADPPEVAVEGVDLVGLPPVADDRHFASPARAVLLCNLGC